MWYCTAVSSSRVTALSPIHPELRNPLHMIRLCKNFFLICGWNFTQHIVNSVAQRNYYTAEYNYSMIQSLYLSFCLPCAAPSEPQDLQVDIISHSSLTLSWDPPQFPGGVVTHYRVSWVERVICMWSIQYIPKVLEQMSNIWTCLEVAPTHTLNAVRCAFV